MSWATLTGKLSKAKVKQVSPRGVNEQHNFHFTLDGTWTHSLSKDSPNQYVVKERTACHPSTVRSLL